MAVANIDDPAALGHLIAGALRVGTEEKQKLLEEIDVAKRLRHLSRILARELEVVQLGTQIQTQVQSEIDKGQREFFLRQQLKAIQEELGEEDEQQAEVNELRERIDAAELPEHAPKAADRELSRLEKLPPAAAEHGVIRTYLEWLVELPWSSETEDDLDIAPRPQGARRRPLRPRKSQGPHPRVPGGAQAQPGLAGADPLLRRPPRRRQDQPRPLDREGARPRVRADLGRRRPRRGRDPRPPPHLYRGAAGDDRPRPARRRLAQPRLHDRRDRQDGRRLPRRPRLGDAGGARPGPERLLPRPLPRPRVRPLRRRLHRHRQRPRHDPRPAPGPDGDDRTGRLHGRGEAPHRPPLPGPAPDRGQRPEALADRVRRRRPDRDRSRSTPARPASATSSARSARSAAKSPARSPKARPRPRSGSPASKRASCSAAAASSPSSAAAPRTPASPPASPGRRPAATSSSSRRRRCRARAS